MQTEADKLRKSWAKQDGNEIASAINDLIGTRYGRRFLWWLLQIGKVGTQPFTGNALTTAFNSGELNVGQQILEMVTEVNADGYLTMMKENANEQRERDHQLGDAYARDRDLDNGGNYDGD